VSSRPHTRTDVALYRNLKALEGRSTLFGHQDDLAYGHDWWAEDGRSDVKEVVGAYPSVLGFDIGRLEIGSAVNLDNVDFENMKRWIRQGHQMGSVITLSWHSVNPVTGGGYADNVLPDTIAYVLPGGSHHHVLVDWLDRFADFAADLVDANGTPIPIVFRPYHEHSGDWFWWGLDNGLNTIDNFVALWRFTVTFLREYKGMHNLLWTISPDRSRMDITNLSQEYVDIYPGDEYVDILGIDNYWDVGHPANTTPHAEQFDNYVRTLETVARLAQQRHKLAAQTETAGARGHEAPWTGYLLKALESNAHTRRILWSLVWRNAVGQPGGAPYPGEATAADFVEFHRAGFTMFNDTLPDLYDVSGGTRRRNPLGPRGEAGGCAVPLR
jgi:mannan endo-1,4-beta-mannosidase